MLQQFIQMLLWKIYEENIPKVNHFLKTVNHFFKFQQLSKGNNLVMPEYIINTNLQIAILSNYSRRIAIFIATY